ncbi:unnamed protein product [Diamesa hyperborea]
MFISFFGKKKQLKGYKVVKNSDRSKRYGIAANSLENLLNKVRIKLKIDIGKCYLYLPDGSIVDNEEYFQSLPAQTLFVIGTENEGIKSDFQLLYETFRKVNHDIFNAKELVSEYLKNIKNGDILKVLNKICMDNEERALLRSIDEHEEWFGGDKKFKTKEEVMRKKAQDRIKGYFYKTKDELTKSSIYKSSSLAKKLIDDLLSAFFLFLSGVNYFSTLFDRTCGNRFIPSKKIKDDEIDAISVGKKPIKRKRISLETKEQIRNLSVFKKYSVTLCNETGDFNCHGLWFDESCKYSHKINPYYSRENLIFFQIFNLDHQIEISRSIFPSILKNIENLVNNKALCSIHKMAGVQVSILTYFLEIFTVKNMKFVHIICHDKANHSKRSSGRVICVNCNEYKYLEKIKRDTI